MKIGSAVIATDQWPQKGDGPASSSLAMVLAQCFELPCWTIWLVTHRSVTSPQECVRSSLYCSILTLFLVLCQCPLILSNSCREASVTSHVHMPHSSWGSPPVNSLGTGSHSPYDLKGFVLCPCAFLSLLQAPALWHWTLLSFAHTSLRGWSPLPFSCLSATHTSFSVSTDFSPQAPWSRTRASLPPSQTTVCLHFFFHYILHHLFLNWKFQHRSGPVLVTVIFVITTDWINKQTWIKRSIPVLGEVLVLL